MIGKKYITAMIISAFITPVFADISSDMGDFWSNSGGTYNTTKPGSYSSQAGGYITLGGMQARTPIRSTNLATIQLPSIRAGCSGIDVFSGGFSFVNSAQLTAAAKAIASNAVGYFFKGLVNFRLIYVRLSHYK